MNGGTLRVANVFVASSPFTNNVVYNYKYPESLVIVGHMKTGVRTVQIQSKSLSVISVRIERDPFTILLFFSFCVN